VDLLAGIAILGLFFVLLVTAFVMAQRYVKVGPNEVLVISGRRRQVRDTATGQPSPRNYRILKGGGTFILPVLERVDALSLELMTIDVNTPKVYTVAGVPITVDGVAQVKVRGDEVSIATAAEQFLSKSTQEIKDVALQTLEGHLRAILGTLTVEELYRDRDAFAQRVQEVAAGDLANMGLAIISFTIRDIRDEEGYLAALGKARTAEVKRDATIGEANAMRDARIQSAKAMQSAREAEFAAETMVAESEKNYNVRKAQFDAETNREKARSELAYTLEQNKMNQVVRVEAVQVEVVEKQKQIEVQEQEVLRRERELEAQVRKPAEAKRFEVETLATARRFQLEQEAEGEAAAARTVGIGQAAAEKARGLAQAEVSRASGLAEAAVIEAQGKADAEAKRLKAAAWATYNQAAIIEQLLAGLPSLASAVSAPLANVDRIVLIGDGHGSGVNRLTGDVAASLAQMPALIEALTGVDIIGSIQSLPVVQGLRQQAASDGGSPAAEQPAPPAAAEPKARRSTTNAPPEPSEGGEAEDAGGGAG
jgi:flotillin